jgi:hypothetical protein
LAIYGAEYWLVAKNEDFGLQCRPRSEQPGYGGPDEPEELAHRADYQPIRGMTSAVEFPVGTGIGRAGVPTGRGGRVGGEGRVVAARFPWNFRRSSDG